MPKVSVIIPTYNCATYLPDAIDSVLAQTFKDFEVIVVDDGSTDNTKEVVKKYGLQIKYLYQENKGPSAARNRGIKEAQGEYIAFLDSDDMWVPEKIEKQLEYFIENPSCGLIYTGYDRCSENGRTINAFIPKQISKQTVLKNIYLKNVISTASTVMVNKACFDKVGLFDEGLAVAEDWDMWLRIIQKHDFYYINKPLVKVRIRSGSQSYYGSKNLDNEMKLLDKLFSEPSLHRNIILRLKAYSYRYYAAAIAYKENNDNIWATRYFFKSFLLYPFSFFNRSRLCLLLNLILGEKLYSATKLALGTNRTGYLFVKK